MRGGNVWNNREIYKKIGSRFEELKFVNPKASDTHPPPSNPITGQRQLVSRRTKSRQTPHQLQLESIELLGGRGICTQEIEIRDSRFLPAIVHSTRAHSNARSIKHSLTRRFSHSRMHTLSNAFDCSVLSTSKVFIGVTLLCPRYGPVTRFQNWGFKNRRVECRMLFDTCKRASKHRGFRRALAWACRRLRFDTCHRRGDNRASGGTGVPQERPGPSPDLQAPPRW